MLDKNLGNGGAGMHGSGEGSAAFFLKQLESQTTEIVAGTTADTEIFMGSSTAGDVMVSSIAYPDAGGAPIQAEMVFNSNGNIQSTVDTSAHTIVVVWRKGFKQAEMV